MYLDLSPSQHPFNRLMLIKHCRCFNCTCRSPNLFSTDRCWQNTAGALPLTPKEGALVVARKEQMAPQICLQRWATRQSWNSWIFASVLGSQTGPGNNFRMAPGRSCSGHRASQRRSCGVCVAMGNWKAEPKGIHADMIRVKGEKRRIRRMRKILLYTCLCIAFIVFTFSSSRFDMITFRSFVFEMILVCWHWTFCVECLVFKILDVFISSACWRCCNSTGAKCIGAA